MPRFVILSNPRSGSTLVASYLRCHPEISVSGELLNADVEINGDPLKHTDTELSKSRKAVVGLKVFAEQLKERTLRLDDLVRHLGISYIIVVWRESILEELVSLRIAELTNEWYNTEKPTLIQKVSITSEELQAFVDKIRHLWNEIAEIWPIEVVPIFVKYEDLIENKAKEINKILTNMSLSPNAIDFLTEMERQNPEPVESKVETWHQLPDVLQTITVNIAEIITEAKWNAVKVPADVRCVVPDPEPPLPPGGYYYRVAEPLLPRTSKENLLDAIDGASVSSNGVWPKELSGKLKQIFEVPVAQPCCNGFMALVLALQAAGIREQDEVILPSFTMVAVPNAITFVGAKPVFIDNAADSYNPSWNEISQAATQNTKAVIVCHTYGVPMSDITTVAEECKLRGWYLIEDISECVGISTTTQTGVRLLGTFGDLACASMYANKIVHAGDGGFVIAKDPKLAGLLKSLVNHGFTSSYHFLHFTCSVNAKMNGLGAALACGCLDVLEEILQQREEIAKRYRLLLSASSPLVLMPRCGPRDTPWVLCALCEDKKQRQELRQFLASNGVETRNFFFPLHLQPAYLISACGSRLPNAEKLAAMGLYFPTHSNLRNEDVDYICSLVSAFYNPQQKTVGESISPCPNWSVRINPGSYETMACQFDSEGRVISRTSRDHPLVTAVNLQRALKKHLLNERWDDGELLIRDIKECIEDSTKQSLFSVADHLKPYLDYLQSQRSFEPPVHAPWIHEDISQDETAASETIPTTTDAETIQLLCWLAKTIPACTILEIGCWLGHTVSLMALAAREVVKSPKVYAVDCFRWQSWMDEYVNGGVNLRPEDSFLDLFLHNVAQVHGCVEAVEWPYGGSFPTGKLENVHPDLVFLDLTRNWEELEVVWEAIRSQLIPNKTVVVLNGLTRNSIPFVTRHQHELIPVAKPLNAYAKAFRFTVPDTVSTERSFSMEPRRVNINTMPSWNHHHQRAFITAIAELKQSVHDDLAAVNFIPAVEEILCDNAIALTRPWIGIVHSVPHHPEQFYAPDLERLCSKRYHCYMKQCLGLFTLTETQACFLRSHWPESLQPIPICPLKMPFIPPIIQEKSKVLHSWRTTGSVDIVFVGSFARDIDLFFRCSVPPTARKVILVGDEIGKEWASTAPSDVNVLGRLDSEMYEKLLNEAVLFLALKHDGAANTTILECIARNTPILVPRMKSCIEYIGESYPLLYDLDCSNFNDLIQESTVQAAISYLENMKKCTFSTKEFCASVQSSATWISLPPHDCGSVKQLRIGDKFDVTVCICSFKRTHHLQQILSNLWSSQSFSGTMQIIVWNNNDAREQELRHICSQYLRLSGPFRDLELIQSSQNYYCTIRMVMVPLMRSECLLICDDDILPSSSFVQFFLDAHKKHPKDVLCVRGHKFLQHTLNVADPTNVWLEYENLKFVDEFAPEQDIHFVHADACLLPKTALQELCSQEIADPSFALVDDYWFSFILSHKYGRTLRKLCIKGTNNELTLLRTDDSDTPGLALHTQSKVRDARIRMYIHHMLRGWPRWQSCATNINGVDDGLQYEEVAKAKKDAWKSAFVGCNVSSTITKQDAEDLLKIGVRIVRIGAVGSKEPVDYELSGFLSDFEHQLNELLQTIRLLGSMKISVVLTLDKRIASPEVWMEIAKVCVKLPTVVGYDLVNEPRTALDEERCRNDAFDEDSGLTGVLDTFCEIIAKIAAVDPITPIIVETTFWASPVTLKLLSPEIESLKQIRNDLMVSVHFYDPLFLTTRHRNKNRFKFPGEIPQYDYKYSDTTMWDDNKVMEQIQMIAQWGKVHNIPIHVGEFGIARDIEGASDYLQAVTNACHECGISCFLYSFREVTWDAMNYELGTNKTIYTHEQLQISWQQNPLMQVLITAVAKTMKP